MIKVLLVEDEKRMNEALTELLRQEGYEVDAMFSFRKRATICSCASAIRAISCLRNNADNCSTASTVRTARVPETVIMGLVFQSRRKSYNRITVKSALRGRMASLRFRQYSFRLKVETASIDFQSSCVILPATWKIDSAE